MATIEIAPESERPGLLEGPGRSAEPAAAPRHPVTDRLDGAALQARASRAISENLALRCLLVANQQRAAALQTWTKETIKEHLSLQRTVLPRAHRETRPAPPEMVDLVAHDLANGLAAAQMCVEALSQHDREPSRRLREYVSVLGRSLRQMKEIVADLRDTRQMRFGRFILGSSSSVSPADLVSTAIDEARSRASDRRFVAACTPGLAPVRADAQRVQRVFANLIGNALKFTAAGGVITIGAGPGPSPRQVSFFVRDDGEGISEADQARIFEPYWQANHDRYGGSGLGLTVCQGIVEAHGGRMSLTSRPGSGSTFAFTLPRAAESATAGVNVAAAAG